MNSSSGNSSLSIAALLATILTLTTVPLMGAITIIMQGQFEATGGSVFGQNGTNLPVTSNLILDISSGPTVLSRSSGTSNETLYGYQFDAVTGVEMTFGTKTWDIAALDLLSPASGFEASLWLNANPTTESPTRAWMQLSDGEGSIQLGSLTIDPEVALQPTLSVVDYAGGGFGNTAVGSLDAIISIPEPTTTSLVS